MTESSKYPDRIISGDEHALVIAILRGYPPCIARNDALRAMDEARFLTTPDVETHHVNELDNLGVTTHER